MFLYPTVYTGCPYGPDDVWNIIWPNTPGGSISSQPCPGGVDAIGLSSVIQTCYVAYQNAVYVHGTFMLSSSSPVHLVCDAWVEVLWLLCIVYVIRAQPAELPR